MKTANDFLRRPVQEALPSQALGFLIAPMSIYRRALAYYRPFLAPTLVAVAQIGRASCRERV